MRELSTLGIAYHSPALDPFCGRLRGRARPASPGPRAWPRRPAAPARLLCRAPLAACGLRACSSTPDRALACALLLDPCCAMRLPTRCLLGCTLPTCVKHTDAPCKAHRLAHLPGVRAGRSAERADPGAQAALQGVAVHQLPAGQRGRRRRGLRAGLPRARPRSARALDCLRASMAQWHRMHMHRSVAHLAVGPGRRACRAARAQVQSFKSRVLFREACAAIPADAVLLEVGPHAIMRAPLRQVRSSPRGRIGWSAACCTHARTHAGTFMCAQHSFETRHCCLALAPANLRQGMRHLLPDSGAAQRWRVGCEDTSGCAATRRTVRLCRTST